MSAEGRGWTQNEDGTWGPQHVTDEGRELQPQDEDAATDRAYELASSDVVVGLTFGQVLFVAENLSFLASVDEGENTDFDGLSEQSQFFYARLVEAADEKQLIDLVGEDGAAKLRAAHGGG